MRVEPTTIVRNAHPRLVALSAAVLFGVLIYLGFTAMMLGRENQKLQHSFAAEQTVSNEKISALEAYVAKLEAAVRSLGGVVPPQANAEVTVVQPPTTVQPTTPTTRRQSPAPTTPTTAPPTAPPAATPQPGPSAPPPTSCALGLGSLCFVK